jgi:hypothetical protein
LALFAAVACSAKAKHREALLNEAEYLPYRERGTGSISGQAYLKTAAGVMKTAHSDRVMLTPVTTFSTDYFDRVVLHGEDASAEKDSREVWWVTVADGEGRFRFDALPAGEYYVTCKIVAMVPARWFWGDPHPSETVAWAKVKLAPGEHAEVVVTRPGG